MNSDWWFGANRPKQHKSVWAGRFCRSSRIVLFARRNHRLYWRAQVLTPHSHRKRQSAGDGIPRHRLDPRPQLNLRPQRKRRVWSIGYVGSWWRILCGRHQSTDLRLRKIGSFAIRCVFHLQHSFTFLLLQSPQSRMRSQPSAPAERGSPRSQPSAWAERGIPWLLRSGRTPPGWCRRRRCVRLRLCRHRRT